MITWAVHLSRDRSCFPGYMVIAVSWPQGLGWVLCVSWVVFPVAWPCRRVFRHVTSAVFLVTWQHGLCSLSSDLSCVPCNVAWAVFPVTWSWLCHVAWAVFPVNLPKLCSLFRELGCVLCNVVWTSLSVTWPIQCSLWHYLHELCSLSCSYVPCQVTGMCSLSRDLRSFTLRDLGCVPCHVTCTAAASPPSPPLPPPAVCWMWS